MKWRGGGGGVLHCVWWGFVVGLERTHVMLCNPSLIWSPRATLNLFFLWTEKGDKTIVPCMNDGRLHWMTEEYKLHPFQCAHTCTVITTLVYFSSCIFSVLINYQHFQHKIYLFVVTQLCHWYITYQVDPFLRKGKSNHIMSQNDTVQDCWQQNYKEVFRI